MDVPAAPVQPVGHSLGVYSELPYDGETGGRAAAGAVGMTLDLRVGRRVKLAAGNEPMAVAGTEGTVGARSSQGHYVIEFDDGKTRVLGSWFLAEAMAGALEQLPIVMVPA